MNEIRGSKKKVLYPKILGLGIEKKIVAFSNWINNNFNFKNI